MSATLSAAQRHALVELARGAIAERFGAAPASVPAEAWLEEKRAVFVTLTLGGALRGCVGQLEPRFSLAEAVRHAAQAAAFRDERFLPLAADELPRVAVEISVLSPLEPLPADSEAEALAAVRPGVDGLVLRCGGRSGVFIPEMWKQLPDARDFLFHLKRKAGLPGELWTPGTHLERFTAELVDEHALGGAA